MCIENKKFSTIDGFKSLLSLIFEFEKSISSVKSSLESKE